MDLPYNRELNPINTKSKLTAFLRRTMLAVTSFAIGLGGSYLYQTYKQPNETSHHPSNQLTTNDIRDLYTQSSDSSVSQPIDISSLYNPSGININGVYALLTNNDNQQTNTDTNGNSCSLGPVIIAPIDMKQGAGETYRNHLGTDLYYYMNERGEVFATANGKVVHVVNNVSYDGEFRVGEGLNTLRDTADGLPYDYPAYGNTIFIEYENGGILIFAHLSPDSIKVKVGDCVTAGQVIANVGATGNAKTVHLHYEVRPDGTCVSYVEECVVNNSEPYYGVREN